eukprot:GHVL01011234.1.p1 GENE.GHVL01011234.1~~GHVL01011234.1.p1  ORF type:complete len:801 (+),score=263.42 GHVL01011234.1:45-2447(+)
MALKRRNDDFRGKLTEVTSAEGHSVWEHKGTPLWDFETSPAKKHKKIDKKDAKKCAIEEYERSIYISKIRNNFSKYCLKYLLLNTQNDALERWMLEQLTGKNLTSVGGRDPLICQPELSLHSSALRRELVSEIPSRLRDFKYSRDMRAINILKNYTCISIKYLEHLTKYVNENIDEYIDSHNKDKHLWESNYFWSPFCERQAEDPTYAEECIKMENILKNIKIFTKDDWIYIKNEIYKNIDYIDNIMKKQYLDRLKDIELKDICTYIEKCIGNLLRYIYRPLIILVLKYIYNDTKYIDNNNNIHINNNIQCIEKIRHFDIKYMDDIIPISKMHFNKLKHLYICNNTYNICNNEKNIENKEKNIENKEKNIENNEFEYRLYTLLKRYITFIGIDPNCTDVRGGNMHAAAPETTFLYIKNNLHVNMECFASPLNCYFNTFCSAFYDTDKYFGSCGSFFDFEPTDGSFEVGPPYTEEVMLKTAEHLLYLLERSEQLDDDKKDSKIDDKKDSEIEDKVNKTNDNECENDDRKKVKYNSETDEKDNEDSKTDNNDSETGVKVSESDENCNAGVTNIKTDVIDSETDDKDSKTDNKDSKTDYKDSKTDNKDSKTDDKDSKTDDKDSKPLSFIVFVPEWPDAEGIRMMSGDRMKKYRKSAFVLRNFNHTYTSGCQFWKDKGNDAEERYYVVPHGTCVYIFQNKSGAKKWPVPENVEKELIRAADNRNNMVNRNDSDKNTVNRYDLENDRDNNRNEHIKRRQYNERCYNDSNRRDNTYRYDNARRDRDREDNTRRDRDREDNTRRDRE